ncbi:hypothetical protein AALP_AA1G033400 [Arabis alpina]|uniref:NAC domain-containing protein n=1 Tax=Arabis alpina TaxID=50452 RepID=A0A087HKT7_ARAAL|nr:hypothetical protein AALP_AA1G033400 [Arabis alpina]
MNHHRPGSRFGPSDLGAVRRYLRNKVERNENECLTTMDVYENEPWLLDHVSTPLFKDNEWYYFVPRTNQSRIVRGRGESGGGTWKSTGKQITIEDGNKIPVGYKRSLVFNKKVNGRPKPTNWLMTEFSLHKNGGEFKDLVLVWIRYQKNKKDNLGFNDAPRVDREHGEVLQLEGQLADDVDDFVNDLEGMLVEEEDPQQNTSDLDLLPPPPQLEGQHGDLDDAYVDELDRKLEESDPQQEQENTSNLGLVPPPPQIHYINDMMLLPPLPPSLQGQGFGFQTMMMTQSNGNDFLWTQEQKNRLDDLGYEGAEFVMLDIDKLLSRWSHLHSFMKYWMSLTKSNGSDPATLMLPSPPIHTCRDVIKDPGEVAAGHLERFWSQNSGNHGSHDSPENMVRATFTMSRNQIDNLKHWVTEQSTNESPVSTFVVTLAFNWVSLIKTLIEDNETEAKEEDKDEVFHLMINVDCRNRLKCTEPIPQTYFGNCMAPGIVSVNKQDLLGEKGVLVASNAIKARIKDMLSSDLLKTAPAWGEGARKWGNGVEIGLALEKEKMNAFASNLKQGINKFEM